MFQTLFVAGLHFVVFMPFSSGQVNYTIHTAGSNWTSASKTCSLATPMIDFTANANYLVDFGDSAIQLEMGEYYWIGYQKTYQMFKYEGCAAIPSGQSYNYRLLSIPGLCFTACSLIQSTYFGLRRTYEANSKLAECSCLTDKPAELLERGCNLNCINKPIEYPLVLCGGLKHMSVYSIETELDVSHVKNHPNPSFVGDCVTYYQNVDKNSPMWFWTGCTISLHPLCEPIPTEVERLRRLVEFVDENNSWVQSAQYCLNQDMFPSSVSYNKRQQYNKEMLKIHSPSWTAFFRDMFVYIPDQDVPVSSVTVPDVKCAYVTLGEDKIPRVFFCSCLVAKKMNFICQRGIIPTTTLTSPKASVSLSSDQPSSLPNSDNVTNTLVGTTESTTSSHEGGAIAGIVVGALLVIVVAIVLAVLLRRRRMVTHKQEPIEIQPDICYNNEGSLSDTSLKDVYITPIPNELRTVQTQSSVEELSPEHDTTFNHDLNQARSAGTSLPVSGNTYEKLQAQCTYENTSDSAANTIEHTYSLLDDDTNNSLNAENKLSMSLDDDINKSELENVAYDYVVPEMHHPAGDYPNSDNQYLTIVG